MESARWCAVAAVEQSGLTALSTAAGKGLTDIVRVLVEAGANKDVQAEVRLIFPVHLCLHGVLSEARFILCLLLLSLCSCFLLSLILIAFCGDLSQTLVRFSAEVQR